MNNIPQKLAEERARRQQEFDSLPVSMYTMIPISPRRYIIAKSKGFKQSVHNEPWRTYSFETVGNPVSYEDAFRKLMELQRKEFATNV